MPHNLTIVTFNCQCFNEAKVPFLSDLFNKCDILLLQEHGLYKTQFDLFDRLDGVNGVGKHGVSSMDERVLLSGRPHGGSVILWKYDLNLKVDPVECTSQRLSAILLTLLDGKQLLICCLYMPCDDRGQNKNLIEFEQVLNEVEVLLHSNNVDMVVLGGDWNTDISRDSYQSKMFTQFCDAHSLYLCTNDPCCNFEYTFCSKSNGARTLIDHVLLSENLVTSLHTYESIDSIQNMSDHVPVQCVLEIEVYHTCNKVRDDNFAKDNLKCGKKKWKFASEKDLCRYTELLDKYLKLVRVSEQLLQCRDVGCTDHQGEITELYRGVINACTKAADEVFSCQRQVKSKVIPGWNEFVEDLFRAALYWHNVWTLNDRPTEGMLFELRKNTRKEYHQALKDVIRNSEQIKCEKIARNLSENKHKIFWAEVKKYNNHSRSSPGIVDGFQGKEAIAKVFANKFEELYNIVGYDDDELAQLSDTINCLVHERCCGGSCSDECSQNTHEIGISEVEDAIAKLSLSKSDDISDLLSDHIIHGKYVISRPLSVLFTAMLWHGFSPEDMLKSTMVPIPKGRWSNLSLSSNFRAITLGSIFMKVLELVIMKKEACNLMSNDLQFGFKTGLSTTLCTSMIQETVSYFNHEGSNVYGLLLDASKAFDRVKFTKLFKILIQRGMCPMFCRLLLNMYVNQKLRVRWNNIYSDFFSVKNGVKQGGVISPCLFCIYIDGLLNELEMNGSGCYMGGVFAGAFAYADDITLLAPSISALKEMIRICEKYASAFSIKFNSDKSQFIVFGSNKDVNVNIKVNGQNVEKVDSVIHLGHILAKNIYSFDVSKCIGDFNRQCNMLLGNFKYASAFLRNHLFKKFCSSFYGSQILPLFDQCIDKLCKQWRIAVRRVWKIPWQSHSSYLPHLVEVMDPKLWFEKRCIAFVNKAMHSNNKVVSCITGMGQYGVHSVIGANFRYLAHKYEMKAKAVRKAWDQSCTDRNEDICKVVQIRELIYMRDKHGSHFLNRMECKDMIDFLCTN